MERIRHHGGAVSQHSGHELENQQGQISGAADKGDFINILLPSHDAPKLHNIILLSNGFVRSGKGCVLWDPDLYKTKKSDCQ